MREETLRDIMTTNVTYSNPQDPVMQAAQKMKQLNVGSIPVCDANQNVIGMITDRDICLRCVADNLPNSTPVQQVMSQNVVTASPDMTVDKAAHLMSERQIRRLPRRGERKNGRDGRHRRPGHPSPVR